MNDEQKAGVTSTDDAIKAIQAILDNSKLSGEEREGLRQEFAELEEILSKLRNSHIEICVFGEINAGKSSMLNALLGTRQFESSPQGDWTRKVSKADWRTTGYSTVGVGNSKLVLVDTPGINAVEGQERAELAERTVRYADIVLFVIDGDLNDVEYSALEELHLLGKPLVVAINKMDIFSKPQREKIHEVVRARLSGKVRPEDIVFAAADPLERDVVLKHSDGSETVQLRKPRPQVDQVELRILEILQREGKALAALSASLFASEVSGTVREKIVEIRRESADKVAWKYALLKAVGITLNPIPLADIAGGAAVDVLMIKAIGEVYGFTPTLKNTQALALEIGKAMGLLGIAEAATHVVAGVLEVSTFGLANLLTAVPQGAVAGWSSLVVGKACIEYYSHNGSWGGQDPKIVLKRVLDEVDKESVMANIKEHIQAAISKKKATKT